ncbi:MAG: alpha-galactosidase [Muribaculaceae bacterium]|nr:alpha-galactosidase [Muribaculaceae bacterium]
MKRILISIFVVAAFVVTAQAIDLPTMGWSSWNTFAINISDSLIMSQADACVANGLDVAGYKYINIDDGFFGGRDRANGSLLIHPVRFPKGMKVVVDHIHSLGLKAGIYSDAGANTCGNWSNNDTIARGVGLLGHELQDADLYFNRLGFDFIKVDFCGGNPEANTARLDLSPRERYEAIARAIVTTGRNDVRLNVCRWNFPGTWVADVALSWRTTGDIDCSWSSVKSIIAENLYLSAYCGNGHYNDMDMLEVGRTLTAEEDKTHFGMWCIMSSPLLIGCDMRNMRRETLDLIKNPELIALNQDPLGLQAYVVKADEGTCVLAKDIEQYQAGSRAVAFYNPTDDAREMAISFAELGLAGQFTVRDLYERRDIALPKHAERFSVTVPAHGCRIYKVTGTQRLERKRYEAETAFLTAYQELYNPLAVGTAFYTADATCSGGMKVTNLGIRPDNDLQWRNVYVAHDGERTIRVHLRGVQDSSRIFLRVNDDDATLITAADIIDECATLRVKLRHGDNTIRLSSGRKPMPDVDYMEIVE